MSGAPRRTVLTVDGIDGSGKSVLARRMLNELPAATPLLCVDDFRRPLPQRDPRDPRDHHDFYYEERFDLAALDRCVAEYLAGATHCRYPVFDSVTERLGPERELRFERGEVLVIEGVFVARLAAFSSALSIFVDVSEEQARQRILERDIVHKRRTRAEVEARMEQRYFPAYRRYLREERVRERAHVLLDHGDLNHPQVRHLRLQPVELAPPVRRMLAALGWIERDPP